MDEKGNVLSRFKVTYIDPNIHLYLMAFSVYILVFVVIPPILILMVYSIRLCNRPHSHLSPRLNLALSIVNTYQGCYKDGTNGTQDYRIIYLGGFLALGVLLLLVGEVLFVLVKVHGASPANGLQIAFTILYYQLHVQ